MGRTGAEDRSLWRYHGDNFRPQFSTRNTWNQIRETHPICDWYKGVWFSNSTPKYAFITWLAFHDRLATGDKLMSWNVGARVSCIFCGEEVETRDHLFFACSYSSQVWAPLIKGVLQRQFTVDWSSLSPLLLNTTWPKLHTFTLRYVFQITLHSIWRERNGRRHGESPTPAATLVKHIDKNVRNRFSTLRTLGKFDEGLRYWFYCRSV